MELDVALVRKLRLEPALQREASEMVLTCWAMISTRSACRSPRQQTCDDQHTRRCLLPCNTTE
jgi:hypothetical protein